MQTLIVVNDLVDWPYDLAETQVVCARDYLTKSEFIDRSKTKVYNLCRSYRYQKTGYYVSLLANARRHKPFPSISTIQDIKSSSMISLANDECSDLIEKTLKSLDKTSIKINVFFGRSRNFKYQKLATQLFKKFPAPLLELEFVKSGRAGTWRLRNIQPLAIHELVKEQQQYISEMAEEYFRRHYQPRTRRNIAAYDLAILHDPNEKEPPSGESALRKFFQAAEEIGFDVEMIGKDDLSYVGQFDALFIRQTTSVNDRTYRFAQKAAAEGLVVIDDPESIFKCTNKVFLAELFALNNVPAPETLIVHRNNIADVSQNLGFPCILKQPDSSFSQGVVKVANKKELDKEIGKLLNRSELVIAQRFMPTSFDWRIGILDRKPIYACRYFMARRHWQIIRRDAGKVKQDEGNAECVDISQVPAKVIHAALKAANLIGDGLYGVDLKEVDGKPYLIEVNDNPSIDVGSEDVLIGDDLYLSVMRVFRRRIEKRRGI